MFKNMDNKHSNRENLLFPLIRGNDLFYLLFTPSSKIYLKLNKKRVFQYEIVNQKFHQECDTVITKRNPYGSKQKVK